MTQYRKQVTNGVTEYFNASNNKKVAEDKLDVAVKEELDLANPGQIIDSESIVKDESDGLTNADGSKIDDANADSTPATNDVDATSLPADVQADLEKDDAVENVVVASVPKPSDKVEGGMDDGKEAPKSRNPYRQPAKTSEKGFGFVRRNGKTVDIFDLKTPHTELKYVAGLNVPLSKASYDKYDEAEIYDRLVELGLVDEDAIYEQQA